MKKQISVADLVMLIGGVVVFLFSFLSFYKFGGDGRNAWSTGFFPVATLLALMGLAMAVVALLNLFGVKLPSHVLTFDWKQINVVWGITTFGFLLAFLVTDKAGAKSGIGLIMMFVGSIAMAAGAILALLGKGTNMVSLPGSSHPHGGSDTGRGSGSPPPPPPPTSGPRTPPPPPPPPPPV